MDADTIPCVPDEPLPLRVALARSALSAEQSRFLALHLHHNVEQWKWYWSDTLLRAKTDKERVASLGRVAVEQLVAWGLMACGAGFSMYVTAAGRDATVEAGTC